MDFDPRKKNFDPTFIDFGPVKFYLARHFGFCYGVENAIEISYRALEENQGKNVYLLSQMIHNPEVNNDLEQRGIRFILETDGTPLMDWNEITPEDIVIIPAFGTTLDWESKLSGKGIQIQKYNTTCPFVEKVWNRSYKLAEENFTIVIHGKHYHEETRATFSRSSHKGKSIIVKDLSEAVALTDFIKGSISREDFMFLFEGKMSQGFDPESDLQRIGVVNQTTMLASETQHIADLIKDALAGTYGVENLSFHYADTRDTLCYATNDNQDATKMLLKTDSDLAIVVGGYNSSNTSHLVELLEVKFPTFFIKSPSEIHGSNRITRYDINKMRSVESEAFLPDKTPVSIAITSGASCPDTLLDAVLLRILQEFNETVPVADAVSKSLLK
jgi:4-hydroxy-3-methylbut-2-enyl diphosphate reductase